MSEKVGDIIKDSEFFYFGILPQQCIHSLIEDEYSKMYIPQQKCECGCGEWVNSTMKMFEDINGYEFPKKYVHRCANCNEVRMADHIGVKDE